MHKHTDEGVQREECGILDTVGFLLQNVADDTELNAAQLRSIGVILENCANTIDAYTDHDPRLVSGRK